jgi:hypothetical protein
MAPFELVAGLKVTRLSDVERAWPTFLYPARIPERSVTLLAGDPGLGKSTWATRLAAQVTRGELGEAAPVLFALGEDGTNGVFHGRMEAAGAAMDQVHVFDGENTPFTLPDGVAQLSEVVKRHRPRLVVFDPMDNFLTDQTDTRSATSCRNALKPLQALAEESDFAALLVVHLNKSQSNDPVKRIAGSVGGIYGFSRSALLFTPDPDALDGDSPRRALGHVKTNWGEYADTELYDHQGVDLPDASGKTMSVSRLNYAGVSSVPGRELLADHSEGGPATKEEEAGELLADLLTDDKWTRKTEVVKAAKRLTISLSTLDRAIKQLGVQTKREGFPAVAFLRLPSFVTRDDETEVTKLAEPPPEAENGRSASQSRHLSTDDETEADHADGLDQAEALISEVFGGVDRVGAA